MKPKAGPISATCVTVAVHWTVCAMLVLFLSLPMTVQADQSGDFVYTANGDGTITITGYAGPGGAVTIPEEIDDQVVSAIGTRVFQNNYALTSVVIPEGVTSIGSYAFDWCRNLTNVVIPASALVIEDAAFEWCLGLKNVTLPEGMTIINPGLFAYSGLTAVTIPDSVITVAPGAFIYCFDLASVRLGVNVANINGAFLYCGLTNITIPASVTNVGSGPFNYCGNLAAISVDAPNAIYCSVDGVLFDKSRTQLLRYPPAKSGSSYTITNSVARIGDWAFYSCVHLNSLRIPGSVTNVGISVFSAFYGPVNLYFEGNAPNVAYQQRAQVTAFYLSWKNNWGSSWGEFPTRIWLPRIEAGDGNFGVQTNQFGFKINWASGLVVKVDAWTDLIPGVWRPVGTNTLTDGTAWFSDSQWTNYPRRFYRVRWP